MTEKKKYNIKKQIILSQEDAAELISFLEKKRGNQAKMAEDLGVSTQAITGWKRVGFPKYCKSYLEMIRLIEQLTKKG
jgi:DNA-binding XRE family transcriptional regulator